MMQKIRCANSVNNGKLVNICSTMLPIFYYNDILAKDSTIQLNEDTSKHIAQVLRMKKHEQLELTDGKGSLATAEIVDDHKKKVIVKINERKESAQDGRKITIAISILKNANRFEWFLEKATEIGVFEIIPMICERTERQHFRSDRMQNILVSAMLQSKQYWLPSLKDPIPFHQVIEDANQVQKLIAHCMDGEKKVLSDILDKSQASQIILIGPEGDFTNEEKMLAMNNHFLPVSLGHNRLRAETAGVVAAVLMKMNC